MFLCQFIYKIIEDKYMLFKSIIKKINYKCEIISENSKNSISNIILNSKEANNSTIFTSIKGFKTDGHLFLESCYKSGCRDFIVENRDFIKSEWISDSTIICVDNSREFFASISNFLYDFPSKKIKMIGVTGSKGKTTVSTLIHLFVNTKNKASMFTTIKILLMEFLIKLKEQQWNLMYLIIF